jgi:hypothetical protein
LSPVCLCLQVIRKGKKRRKEKKFSSWFSLGLFMLSLNIL